MYAGTRQPLAHPDGRVTPLTLDVTDAAQIQAAAEQVESLDVLINNAGIALFDDLSDRAVLEQHLAVNLFGPYGVIQAFLPLLTRSRGAIVNNVSTMAVAPLPLTPAYAISKAAAFNLTQSLRALAGRRGVRVHAVLTGPTDTDMTRGFDIPKASPESVARAIFDGVENGEEDIFPDPASQSLAESWRSGAVKALERENAAFVSSRARRGISKGTDVDSAQQRDVPAQERARNSEKETRRDDGSQGCQPCRSGRPLVTSCSGARRSTPGWRTSWRASAASCPGSRSRRSTGSTPTTGRGPWPSSSTAAPSS